jgi:hypothetical protein
VSSGHIPRLQPVRIPAAAAALSLTVWLAACGVGTPTDPKAGPLALHFDNLAERAIASGDAVRADYLREIAVGLARGLRPTPVVINADGSAKRFEALSYEGVVAPATGDSEFVVIAWNGWDPSAFVLGLVTMRGSAAGTVTYTATETDGLRQSDSGTVSVTRSGLGGGCSYAALHADPFGPSARCERQTLRWSFNVRLNGGGRVDMPVQTVQGVRLDLGSAKGFAPGATQVAAR